MSLDTKPLALAFHGFLGSASDFQALENDYDILALDLRPQLLNNNSDFYETWEQMEARVLTEIKNWLIRKMDQRSFKVEDVSITVFSYSMGSKVLFSIYSRLLEVLQNFKSEAVKINSSLNVSTLNFVFISSHFGLYQESLNELDVEIENRTRMNQKFLTLLQDQSVELFLETWNALDLFKQDQKLQTDWSFKQIVTYFKSWNRNQEVLPETFFSSLDQIYSISVFYGSEDLKYKTQALRFKIKIEEILSDEHQTLLTFQEINGRSHRLLSENDFKIILKKIL